MTEIDFKSFFRPKNDFKENQVYGFFLKQIVVVVVVVVYLHIRNMNNNALNLIRIYKMIFIFSFFFLFLLFSILSSTEYESFSNQLWNEPKNCCTIKKKKYVSNPREWDICFKAILSMNFSIFWNQFNILCIWQSGVEAYHNV